MSPPTELTEEIGVLPRSIDHSKLAEYHTDKTITEYICYVDGGCQGNGGSNPKAYGSYMIFKGKTKIAGESRFSLVSASSKLHPGRPTNNMAESLSINKALSHINYLNILSDINNIVTIRSDSELTIYQIKGIYKIKDPQLLQISKDRNHILNEIHKKTGRNPWECVRFTKVARARIVEVLGH